jgi:prepilin-type N-terminal cleavage/methylation domain-containing protein
MMRRGTTLIEVLVAMVLIAIILPIALRGVALSHVAGQRAADETIAAELARGKINELIATAAWQDATMQGDFGELPFTWDATAEPWTDATFEQLDVYVRWEDRGRQRFVRLTTLVTAEP